jgi:Tfp pilus assembly protein PilF
MLVTLPFTLLLLDWWPLGRVGTVLPRWGESESGCEARPLGRLILEKVPLFLLSAASCAVTYYAQKKGGSVDFTYPFPLRVKNAFVSVVGYIGKMIWPADLAVMYPHPGSVFAPIPLWKAAVACLLLILITIGVVYRGRRTPYLPMGWFWFLGTLVPVIGLVQVGPQAMADRYCYVPLTGLFVALVWGASTLLSGKIALRRYAVAGGIALVLMLCAAARDRCAFWKDSETLFRHTLSVTSNNPLMENNLGTALFFSGDIPGALLHFRRAVWIKADYHDARLNMAEVLMRENRMDEAISEYREVLRQRPDAYGAHTKLGEALVMAGEWEEGVRHLRQALKLRPDYREALTALEDALRMKDAVTTFRKK